MGVERQVEALVDFAARVLWVVLERKWSHDKAYQEAVKELGWGRLKGLKPKTLYRVSRAIVSDYYLLRYAEQVVYGARGGARRLARLWLLLRGDDPDLIPPELEPGVRRLRKRLLKQMPRKIESVEELLDGLEGVKLLSVKYSFPEWFVEKFVKLLGLEETEKLLEALNEEVWWIRVNTLKADVDEVAERLGEKGVFVRRDPDLPYMLRVVDYSEPLHHLEEMWKGEIVFQDKASALVVEALDPQPGDYIVDFAAAPGIKATLVAALTDNQAEMVLLDVSRERVSRMMRVLKMYGVDLSKVHVAVVDSRFWWSPRKQPKILLDAPCSSSGAVGKDPAIKIHLESREWVDRFVPLQRDLLVNAVTQGERVVYAVCSILPEEGEEHMVKLSLELEDPGIPGLPGYHAYGERVSKARRLLPHVHETQGFFIARIVGKGV
ncbi:Fmu (Sun) domain protein [Pyrolobus fumarii 1A]|uniref:Fmu (Sun) domain protein n=1 Tax=Pyrolobus fumarii (strain DSM 11204 / 1A) TaxID=694429 RepID=G0EHI1_PYRF1|nr:RsmB/NOP family class I SAM-dependent RNA methyltransferase [Pyrolobus fumarii]AEM38556.1 Fmu (Sun) domain protein [Pyrolobus fumarii 1A]